MCLAIYKPADTAADWVAYENGHRGNPHSWGFAVLHDGAIVMRHGLGAFDEFRREFEPFAHCQALIHFRWATHGNTDLLNCHPFLVSDGLAMIHNGIVCIDCNVNTAMSDTWHFNELVLKPLHERDPDFFLRSEVVYTQELAHKGSKFCFLRVDGEHAIWNRDDGVKADDGHWYSNTGYLPARTYSPSTARHIGFYRSACAWGLDSETTASVRHTASKDDYSPIEYDSEDTAGGTLIADPYSGTANDYYDDELDADSDAACRVDLHWDDLRRFGFSKQTLTEVYDLLGAWGIEALHEVM